jgi:cytochrome c2
MPPKKKVAGDAGKGEKVFKTLCAVCHSFAAHGTGPNLSGVVGSNAASKDGFSYS